MKLIDKDLSTISSEDIQCVKSVDTALDQIRDNLSSICVNGAITVTIDNSHFGALGNNQCLSITGEGDAFKADHFFQPHLTNLVSDGVGCVSATKELPDNCSSVFTELAE